MYNTKYNRSLIKIFLGSFTATLVVLCIIQLTLAFFSDIIGTPPIVIASASLKIEATSLQGKDDSGTWSTTVNNWSPGDINEIRFTINNIGYDDVALHNTLEMAWNDTNLNPGVLVLYPANMSDADIITDLNSPTPQYAVYGTVNTVLGQPSTITFDLNDGRLNGSQSANTLTDKTVEISYKLVFNTTTNPDYSGKTLTISLSSTAKYYHNSAIAWDSVDSVSPLIFNSAIIAQNDFILHYNANGGFGAPDSQEMLQQASSTYAFTIPLQEPTYNLNSIFAGWASTYDATTAEYQPGEQIIVQPGATMLYAVWKNPFVIAYENAGKTKSGNYFTMQDMSTTICSAVDTPLVTNEAPEIQLVDIRDNKTYWIAKLADGNCWMTQNLDHDIDVNYAYNSSNTDLVAGTTWTPDRSTIDASQNAITTNGTTKIKNLTDKAIGWAESNSSPYSFDVGNIYYDGTSSTKCDNYLENGCNAGLASSIYNATNEHGHLGNYYNYSAATATNTSSSTAPNSICPANWRLPTNFGANEVSNLFSYYSSTTANPVYLVRGGMMTEKKNVKQAVSNGALWTSNATSTTKAVRMTYNSNAAQSESIDKKLGTTVRCIAR